MRIDKNLSIGFPNDNYSGDKSLKVLGNKKVVRTVVTACRAGMLGVCGHLSICNNECVPSPKRVCCLRNIYVV